MSEENLAAITKLNLLLVEGDDDRRFFSALLRHLVLPDVGILKMEGKNKLRDRVNAIVTLPTFEEDVAALGIVRDADENLQGAFQGVCDALKSAGLEAPERSGEPCGRGPRVAVMILPSETEKGSLEDVLLKSIEDDPAMACVSGYFDCLSESGVQAPRSESKARVQAFLASRERAGLRLGEAAEAGYWRWDAPVFQPAKDFLKGLFGHAS